MNKLIVALALFAGVSQAAHIHSAIYDAKTDEVELDLTYGGCNLDTFRLSFGPCMETYPAQLKAVLDDSNDICKAIIRTKLRLSLEEVQGCRPANMSIRTRSASAPVSVFIGKKQDAVIKAERTAQPVRVDSVRTEIVGENGFPSTQVYVTATFSNSCTVPFPKEFVKVAQHGNNFQTLSLTLAEESNRICPAVYKPVTVTIDLGQYTKPNDGLFSKVIVNGVVAK